MELKKYKLGDIAEIYISSIDKKSKEGEQSVRLCNFVDIYHNWAITKDLVPNFMIASANDNNIKRFSLKEGYVAFTKDSETRDDIGIPAYIADDLDNTVLGYHCALVKPNADILSGKYLNAFLHSDYIKKYFELNATGSGMRYTLSTETLNNIPILAPSLEMQEFIGNIFSDIDRMICLNRQINDNLEAMAKQLYDYWFVQFDFPNEEGKPYKSSGGAMVWNEKLKREIPEGWYAENICKIANILSGGTPSKAVDEYWNNGTIPFFGPTDCNGSVFQIKTADHITQKGLEHCASSLFEEGIVIITARGSIGKLVIVGTPMAMNQSCYALQSKEGEYEYLYFLTTQLIDCLKAKGSGSVFKSIIASDIEHSTLCVATENVVSDFCKKVKPLFEKLKANTIEIAKLTKQRDELLPLLMNGQATVNYHLSAKVYPLPTAYKKAMPIVANQIISSTFIQKSDSHTPSPRLQTSQIRCS